MAFSTYSELQTAVTDWLQDASLASAVPGFIALAEAEFNRVLRVPAMEAVATLATVAAQETVDLPAGLRAIKSITLQTNPAKPINAGNLASIVALYGLQQAEPQQYAISNGRLYLGPVPDAAYDLRVAYWQAIPALSVGSPSNWLLAAHPDVYLFGALMQAEIYGWNDSRAGNAKARMDEILLQINEEGKRAAFPARMVVSHGVRGG